MIERLSAASVGERTDRADIRRAYQRVLDVHADAASPARGPATARRWLRRAAGQASRRCSR